MTNYITGDIIISQKPRRKKMAKRVYSLILDDDVIECVDRLAYENRTNRSNMINQLLAEHFSFVTPEKRMREIFDRIEELLTKKNTLRLDASPSESMISLRSALVYKYNPTVKYSVELYKNALPLLGELRVSMRTQNSTLLLYLMQFYRAWAAIENSYSHTDCRIEDGKFCRKLTLRQSTVNEISAISSNTVGQLITDYITTLDNAMKAYFYNIDTPEIAVAEMEKIYARYLYDSELVI